MSNAPRKTRSFEIIDEEVLRRLAGLALEKLGHAFDRHPEKRVPYEGNLLGICLCQGAANHFLIPDPANGHGIHDFDLWAFYRRQAGLSFCNRSPSTADFGRSRFGRSTLDPAKYKGRRIDVLWRDIPVMAGEDGLDAILRYFTKPRTDSAKALRQKPAVVVWPGKDLGRVLWRPAG